MGGMQRWKFESQGTKAAFVEIVVEAELAGSLEADDAPAVARAFLREMGFDIPVGGNLSLDTARGVPILRRGPTVS